MATSSTTPSSTPSTTTASSKKPASTKLQKAGMIVELSGAATLLAGAALAVGEHHYPVAALFLGGAIAAAVGSRLRKA